MRHVTRVLGGGACPPPRCGVVGPSRSFVLTMFTGLVECMARVVDVVPTDEHSGSYAITIGESALLLGDCHVGDSIAVNGVCLTVTQFSTDTHGGCFRVDLAPETLFRSNLGRLRVGDRVNCERAMAPTTRFGGHIVQGHVDTVATLQSIEPNQSALTLTLRLFHDTRKEVDAHLPLPSTLAPYLVPKGYVTLDGTSLTLIDVSPPAGGALNGDATENKKETIEFTVMLIPHTQEHITLPNKPLGSFVNVEFDMVGKYVYRSLEGQLGRLDQAPDTDASTLSMPMLERVVERAVERVMHRPH